tara:strand:- start:1546 stop:2205 length:660 start_codon:yes stop_codon:yes gene_type:complete
MHPIPEHVYEMAKERASKQKVFERSHRGAEANEVGCLGEAVAEEWMNNRGITFTAKLEETTHDYLISDSLTLDVKTKDRTVVPKKYYDNSAPMYNHTHQRPDYFLFISLERERADEEGDIRRFHTAYILGSISYEELDRVGIPFLKDEIDWRNKTKFWTDCLNVEMWQLIPLNETVQIFKGLQLSPTKSTSINKVVIEEISRRIKDGSMKPRDLPKSQD